MKQIRQYSQDDTRYSSVSLLIPAAFAAILMLAPSAPALEDAGCNAAKMGNAKIMAQAVGRAQARALAASRTSAPGGHGWVNVAGSPDANAPCAKVGAARTPCPAESTACQTAWKAE
jgi:hypothetical protein